MYKKYLFKKVHFQVHFNIPFLKKYIFFITHFQNIFPIQLFFIILINSLNFLLFLGSFEIELVWGLLAFPSTFNVIVLVWFS